MNVLQSDNYSCMSTAAGIVLDRTAADIHKFLGHDSADLIGDIHRGVHPTELVMYACTIGIALLFVEFDPRYEADENVRIIERENIENLLKNRAAILVKDGEHAVAMNYDGLILDPAGGTCDFNVEDYDYALVRFDHSKTCCCIDCLGE